MTQLWKFIFPLTIKFLNHQVSKTTLLCMHKFACSTWMGFILLFGISSNLQWQVFTLFPLLPALAIGSTFTVSSCPTRAIRGWEIKMSCFTRSPTWIGYCCVPYLSTKQSKGKAKALSIVKFPCLDCHCKYSFSKLQKTEFECNLLAK